MYCYQAPVPGRRGETNLMVENGFKAEVNLVTSSSLSKAAKLPARSVVVHIYPSSVFWGSVVVKEPCPVRSSFIYRSACVTDLIIYLFLLQW